MTEGTQCAWKALHDRYGDEPGEEKVTVVETPPFHNGKQHAGLAALRFNQILISMNTQLGGPLAGKIQSFL